MKDHVVRFVHVLLRRTILPLRLQEKLRKINHNFDCMEKCFIYLLICNKYRKQYVDQTVDTFRYRWNNYRSNSRKHAYGISCMQERLYEHFCDSEHSGFLNDVSITFIDKKDPTNPLQRENYWKHTLKILQHTV